MNKPSAYIIRQRPLIGTRYVSHSIELADGRVVHAQLSPYGKGEAGQGGARRGRARRGTARPGQAGRGMAGQGRARRGMAGQGTARQGKAQYN